ncbi:MAG: LysM peptidoglycan-binding domain-containing protein [Bacteriovoracia bacterium]
MKIKGNKTLLLLCLAAVVNLAYAQTTEEQTVRAISRQLKPINDSEWNEIVGTRSEDVYEVQKGDTLWDVSKRIFGNPRYYPKVWSINNDNQITNPHQLVPGQRLVFRAGSSMSAPSFNSSGSFSGDSLMANSLSSTDKKEYEKVDPNKWAPRNFTKPDPNTYDEYGLQKDIRVKLNSRFNFRVPAIANEEKLPYLGEITSARRDGVGLGPGETVFIKSQDQDLQVGQTYTLFGEPEFSREKKSDRSGYIYRATGEVKIISVKDQTYIGVIEKAYDVVRRGDRLYPLLPEISDIKPVPATQALESMSFIAKREDVHNTAQFRFVFFDRGLEDGVRLGNVFRFYEYYDPGTKEKITDTDFLIVADAIVVHATAQFSTGLILRSKTTFSSGDFGVLLTDVSDLEKQEKDRSHAFGEEVSAEDKELDELDRLDRESGEGLGRQEEIEVQELEQWDETKDVAPAEPEATIPSDPSEVGPEVTPDIEGEATEVPEASEDDISTSVPKGQANETIFEEAPPSVEPMQQALPEEISVDPELPVESN